MVCLKCFGQNGLGSIREVCSAEIIYQHTPGTDTDLLIYALYRRDGLQFRFERGGGRFSPVFYDMKLIAIIRVLHKGYRRAYGAAPTDMRVSHTLTSTIVPDEDSRPYKSLGKFGTYKCRYAIHSVQLLETGSWPAVHRLYSSATRISVHPR